MKVSVCIQTYNHRPYIAKALEGALAQVTAFPFEILVGEDESSDGTRDIVLDYATRFPDKIKVFLNSRDKVVYVDGLPTGRFNLVNNIVHASGDYVALLDGDDYRIDARKQQKQANILDSHPATSLCFHNALVEREADRALKPFNAFTEDQEFTYEDILKDWFVATGSIMFRRQCVREFPAWYLKVFNGDYALQLMLARQGTFYYINEPMSVWRQTGRGQSRYAVGQRQEYSLALIYHNWFEWSGVEPTLDQAKQLARRFENLAKVFRVRGNAIGPMCQMLILSARYLRRAGQLNLLSLAKLVRRVALMKPALELRVFLR
jgi:glycosyltransferase involved in cell wall biosynthesis